MGAQALEELDLTVLLSHLWIGDLDRALAWNDKARSFRLLKAVLHVLRDSMTVEEAADLGALLPALLRGTYYERWQPAAVPDGRRTIVAQVQASFADDPLDDPVGAVITAFRFLAGKLVEGTSEDLRPYPPARLRAKWRSPHPLSRVRH